MAHRCKVNGTNYNIIGGRCKVDGTNYNIIGGRCKVNGTAYSISFQKTFTVSGAYGVPAAYCNWNGNVITTNLYDTELIFNDGDTLAVNVAGLSSQVDYYSYISINGGIVKTGKGSYSLDTSKLNNISIKFYIGEVEAGAYGYCVITAT